MSETQDPLHEYKLQQKENYEERNLMKVGTHVLQDDVYTALDPNDNLTGSVYSISDYNQRSTGNVFSVFFSSLKDKMTRLSDFVVPSYSSLTPAEAASSTAFFGVLLFVFIFCILSLF